MEDEQARLLRQQIRQIQQDATLTPQDKARKIQSLMSKKKPEELEKKEEPLDTSITYKDEENKILGCPHYKRNAKLLSRCCKKLYGCRFCHDEKESEHQIIRFETEEMFCMLCKTMGPIDKSCSHCKEEMGCYYCPVCKFIDNDPSKDIYHCDQCGICRMGKIDQHFHCPTCDACFKITQKNDHTACKGSKFKSNCPICHLDMFTSRDAPISNPCGHSMHGKCYNAYIKNNYRCPLCFKSLADMGRTWEAFDQIIRDEPLHSDFDNAKAQILCNDCEKKMEVKWHIHGCKCAECGSYNTRIISTSGFPETFPANRPITNPVNNNNEQSTVDPANVTEEGFVYIDSEEEEEDEDEEVEEEYYSESESEEQPPN